MLGERRDQYAAAMRQAKAQRSTAKAQEFGKMAARFSKVCDTHRTLFYSDEGFSVHTRHIIPEAPSAPALVTN